MTKYLEMLIYSLICSLFINKAMAHEPWLLSHEQVQTWFSKPKPDVFIQWGLVNISLVSIFILLLVSACLLQRYLTHLQRFKPSEHKVGRYRNWSLPILRYCTAGTLLIATLGMIPRTGNPEFAPYLFVPDILLPQNILGYILVGLQVICAFGLLIGRWRKFNSMLLLGLTLAGLALYPRNMLLYLGYFFGIASYLFFEAEKGILLLRWFTGIAFVLSGVMKIMHPNLDVALLTMNQAFTFAIPYDIFTLIMALVEISIGICIFFGIFLRVVALAMFPLFIYLSYILNENILAHLFIYGILLVLIIDG